LRYSPKICSGRAFSLIELLVVIGIISVLLGCLLPAMQVAREAARRAQCLNNLKQIGLGLHNYHSTVEMFPSGYVSYTLDNSPSGEEIGPGWGWGSMILSMMEQRKIYDMIDFSLSTSDPAAAGARPAQLSTFICPSNVHAGGWVGMGASNLLTISDSEGQVLVGNLAASNYVAVAGQLPPGEYPAANNGVFYRNSAIRLRDISDGTSTTLLVGERSPNVANATWVGMIPRGISCTNPSWPVQNCADSNALVLGHTGPSPNEPWVLTPNSEKAGVDGFSSLHYGGCNFVFGDGSVRFLKTTIDPRVFSEFATRAGDEMVDSD
jgi:prepilin-type N-terminal cleavage/methylation domain-containing protein/prepilin-type processing-associated H-X9-DG protein